MPCAAPRSFTLVVPSEGRYGCLMITRLCLLVALGCSASIVACNQAEAPTKPSTMPPEVTAAPASAAAETAATADPVESTAAASGGWRPAKCSEYTYTPKDCQGSPENPSCVDSFELHPDGKAVKTFDDVMARGTYEVAGNTVTIRVPELKYEGTFTIDDDGQVLVGSGDARYQRTDCP